MCQDVFLKIVTSLNKEKSERMAEENNVAHAKELKDVAKMNIFVKAQSSRKEVTNPLKFLCCHHQKP